MEAIAGPLVCATLLLLGRFFGSPITFGLFSSFALGSVAIASVGGTSIPAFAGFGALLFAALAVNKRSWRDAAAILKNEPLVYLVFALVFYAMLSAYLFPRLFYGQTPVFVPIEMIVRQRLLAPVPGNFNQAAYFLFNALAFVAFSIVIRQGGLSRIRDGFIILGAMNAILGIVDLTGRTAGLGDVLLPIRTANYAMLNQELGGFVRIMGGFPESSGFAAASVPALAFAFMDWRHSRSRVSLTVTIALFALLLFSTSSTAYTGLALMGAAYGVVATVSLLRGRIYTHQIVLLATAWTVVTIVLAIHLYDSRILEPMIKMLLEVTVNKGDSESAIERGMWNKMSITNFFDTSGIGVGLGSTRSSSWALSVLGQLGIFGVLAFATMNLLLFYALIRRQERPIDKVAGGAAGAVLLGAAVSSVGGGTADPGMLYFVALALVSASLIKPPSQPMRYLPPPR